MLTLNKKEFKQWKKENDFGTFKGDLIEWNTTAMFKVRYFVSLSKKTMVIEDVKLNGSTWNVYSFDEVNDVQLGVTPKLKKKNRGLRTVVGSVILLGAGTVIGYLSGSDVESVEKVYNLDIITSDGKMWHTIGIFSEKDGKRRLYQAQKIGTSVDTLSGLINKKPSQQ